MTEEDDAVQVALCLKGDASAFEPIVARYQKVLFNVALRMLGGRENARASEGFGRELSTPGAVGQSRTMMDMMGQS